MKRFHISEEEYKAIVEAQRKTRDKNVSMRLRVLEMRYEGVPVKKIAEKLDLHPQSITVMCARYAREGLEEFARNKYTSHNRTLSAEEEAEVLREVQRKADKGQMLTVEDIRAALDEKIGRKTEPSYVYKVLKRNGWRKVSPRSKHPKAADEEAVSASKKLSSGCWMNAKRSESQAQ